VLSYLPLSHISALQFDVIPQVICGSQLYFAKPDALQGSIFDSLKWCRPTYFFAVPRIWEKIEIRLRDIIMKHGSTMKSLFDWSQK
jgi:long-chain-fatty-acid--CoA ligase ACSBG